MVVVGGGDTGADCVGTARRQGALAITQVDRPRAAAGALRRQPLAALAADPPHRLFPRRGLHPGLGRFDENEILGDAAGRVRALRCVRVEWGAVDTAGRRSFKEVPGSGFELKADLVVFAMGFVHTEHSALVTDFGLELNPGACLLTDADLMTSAPGVFAAGDCVLGARLIVTAIDQGRRAAAAADRYLRTK